MTKEIALRPIPGTLTRLSWTPPKDLSFEDWENAITHIAELGASAAWVLGDMWAWGRGKYGDRVEALREGLFGEYTFTTLMQYGWVAGKVTTSTRVEVLTHRHHMHVAHFAPEQQKKWLARAVDGDDGKQWSSGKLKAKIAQAAAVAKTKQADFDAKKLGKYVVLYADPPWQYEHPPMGGSNRSIENHYPTMALEDICKLPVSQIAHDDSVLFMWATSPKLVECMQVLDAWGFQYRTNMVWVKDKIGMGYHARERHELLLIAKLGELPPPPPEARPDSVIEYPRGEHSAKPPCYDMIDSMYPDVRKIELFGRPDFDRPQQWKVWGNQA